MIAMIGSKYPISADRMEWIALRNQIEYSLQPEKFPIHYSSILFYLLINPYAECLEKINKALVKLSQKNDVKIKFTATEMIALQICTVRQEFEHLELTRILGMIDQKNPPDVSAAIRNFRA